MTPKWLPKWLPGGLQVETPNFDPLGPPKIDHDVGENVFLKTWLALNGKRVHGENFKHVLKVKRIENSLSCGGLARALRALAGRFGMGASRLRS